MIFRYLISGGIRVPTRFRRKTREMVTVRSLYYDIVLWRDFLTFSPTGQDRSKVGHNLVPFNTFFSCEISHGSFASQDSIEVGKKLQGPPLFTF